MLDILMLNLFIGIVTFYNGQRMRAVRKEENKGKYKSVNETFYKNEKNNEVNLKKKRPQTTKAWQYYLAFGLAISHLLDSLLSLAEPVLLLTYNFQSVVETLIVV